MRAVLLVLLLAALAVASVPIDRSIDSGDEYSELRDLETVELDRMDHRGEWETRDDEEATEAAVTVASAKGAATKAAATVKPNLRAIRKAARKALKDARRKARKERKARRQARKGGKKSRKGRWSFANRRFVYKKLKSRK